MELSLVLVRQPVAGGNHTFTARHCCPYEAYRIFPKFSPGGFEIENVSFLFDPLKSAPLLYDQIAFSLFSLLSVTL